MTHPTGLAFGVGLAAFLAGCGTGPAPAGKALPTVTYVPMPGRPDLPFSAVVKVGPMLYLSGQLGTDSTGKLVAGGIGPETAQALANIRSLLEVNGSGMARVIKCTAMLADMAEWGAMNESYRRSFPVHPPARSAFGTSGLAMGARIELECMALGDAG